MFLATASEDKEVGHVAFIIDFCPGDKVRDLCDKLNSKLIAKDIKNVSLADIG